jgi:hypothetical protein
MTRPHEFPGHDDHINLPDRQYIRHKNMNQRELILEIIVG